MARREREKALRKYQRRRIARRSLTAGIVVGVVVLGVSFVVRQSGNSATSSEVQELINKAPAAAKAAGCGKVEKVDSYTPEESDAQHITEGTPGLDTYPSTPPVSGPHSPTPIEAGVYETPPDVRQVIHGLEHGGVGIWYSPDVAKSPEIATVTSFVKKNQDHIALAPYDYPDNGAASTLPGGKQFALASWHVVQLCERVPATPVIAEFLSKYRSPTLGGGTYEGDAPETGASM